MKRPLAVMFAVLLAAVTVIPMLSSSTDAAVIVSGTVADEHGVLLENVSVVIADSIETTVSEGATDGSGSFTAEWETDGTGYRIKFEMPGYIVTECSLTAADGGWYDLGTIAADITGITVEMSETVQISGMVLADGAELGGVTVNCLVPGNSDPYASSVTDSEGRFGFELIASRTYSIEFVNDGFGVSYCSLPAFGTYYTLSPADMDKGVFAVMYEQIVKTTISGTVVTLDQEGFEPLAGVEVSVTGGPDVLKTETGDDGKFSFSGIEAGEYKLVFSIERYGVADVHGLSHESGEWTLDLADASEPVDVYVLMSRTYGTLTGEIRNERGSGLSEVHISVIGPNGAVVASGTSSGGKYTISDIPTGRYDVRINRSDLETETKTDVYIGENVEYMDFSTKTKINTYLLGLDLTHMMMFTGMILGAAVISAAIAYRVLIERRALDQNGAEDDGQ